MRGLSTHSNSRRVPLTQIFAQCAKSDLSPQAGRGEETRHAAPSRIGGWNDSAVSQGKNIQVSCDTSVI
jgi:hypothetical protein